MKDDSLITDFRCALPRSAWTDADRNVHLPIAPRGKAAWRLQEYKTPLYSGLALVTSDRRAPVLRIPLDRTGWHAVSIGIAGRYFSQDAIEVRLSGDRNWQVFSRPPSPLCEEPWQFADLTGRHLEVRFPRRTDNLLGAPRDNLFAGLCSVRLTPVRPEHLEVVSSRRHRPLVQFNDGHGLFFRASRGNRSVIEKALGRFDGGNWDICSFGFGGADLVNFPSAVGTLFSQDAWYTPRAGSQRIQKVLGELIAQGIDPFRAAVETVHRQGRDCWAYQRPQSWAMDSSSDHSARSRFFSQHPEYRCVEADGEPLSKLSVAFPAVRQQLCAVLRETLERGVDGVCLAFNRGYPLARYEAAICERYRALHGGDARLLAPDDARLRAVWSEFVTQWIREIRELLDAAGPARDGGRRRLAVMVGPDPAWCHRYGIDAAAWGRDRLLDDLLVYPAGEHGIKDMAEADIAGFRKWIAGTDIRLLPGINSCFDHGLSLREFRRRADRYYQAGADGLCSWDTQGWLARLRLDDPELNALWCEHYLGPEDHDFTHFCGMTYRHFPPHIGF